MNKKNKNNCHYRDCGARTDNLSRNYLLSCPTLIGHLSRIKNKKSVMPILPKGKIQGIFELNNKEVSSFLCLRGASGNQGIFAPARVLEKHSSCRFLIFLRIGRSFEKIFKKIFRDDLSFSTPAALVPILTLATLLSFSIISDSRADAGCLKEDNFWNCYDAEGNPTSSAKIKWTDNDAMEITDLSTGKVTWIDSSGQAYSGTFPGNDDSTYVIDKGIRISKTDYSGSETWYYDDSGKMTSRVKTYSDGNKATTTYENGQSSTIFTDSNGALLNGEFSTFAGNRRYYSNGQLLGYVEATDENGNMVLSSGKVIDSEGNPYEGAFSYYESGDPRFVIFDAEGKVISEIDYHDCTSDSSTGLSYCVGFDERNNERCAVIIKKGSKVIGKTSCATSGYCHWSNQGWGATASDCSTELYSPDGKVIAEYDTADIAQNAYDYDDRGNVIATYDDQCVIESCADGYLERDNSCVKKCGPGYRDMGGFCNHIQWTPAEAAAVLTDDNNNSVTITFRK